MTFEPDIDAEQIVASLRDTDILSLITDINEVVGDNQFTILLITSLIQSLRYEMPVPAIREIIEETLADFS